MLVIKRFSKIFAWLAAGTILAYVIVANSTPVSLKRTISSEELAQISKLSPANRVDYIPEDGRTVAKVNDDLVYFTSKMSFSYDNSIATMKFKNPNNEQISVGYKDQNTWHYNSQIIDAPLINGLNWQKIGGGPYLYQKYATYKTINDFIKNPPGNKTIGVFNYDNSDILSPNVALPTYQPANKNTIISTPMRGQSVIYVYLQNEPFKMSFTKQDLNWYADPDVMKISVFKQQDKVFDASIDDDGNDSNDHQAGDPQSVDIQNPGPGLPENGVYKIVVESSGDSVLTNITTNLHKIVFEGPVYPATNHDVYPGIVQKTQANSLVTNSNGVNVQTYHQALQTVQVGTQNIAITKQNQVYNSTPLSALLTNIVLPKSDVIVNGAGYFAFSPDQFFIPSPYKVLQVNNAEDLAKVDYVITNYTPPRKEGDWLEAEPKFDLHDAIINKGKLSWMINIPGLKENNQTVDIKEIDMTLNKKGWIK